jgi:gliding motility-associated-like protein
MRFLILFISCCISNLILGQNITVDAQTYSPQELIENILIDSDCITNVNVVNFVGGNFSDGNSSFGYFEGNNSGFPFERGIVLSTGRLSNVPGPNDNLSDDDAPGWIGDDELEFYLDEDRTFNATIIEFEFEAIASQISFRYLFASEEYQENNTNTCRFSDLFAFLIRPINDQLYTNIAVVPGTGIPIKVTNVLPEILGGCPAQNEFYFDTFNGVNAPINYNGQTKVLTATADIIPNETYRVKLVIADHINFRFDSAVFLEGGSFQLSTPLGINRLLSTGNALCGDDTLTIDATEPGNNQYRWFKDGVELSGETNATLTIDETGTYNVEILLDNNCESFGEIVIEYDELPEVFNAVLTECDFEQDGTAIYNLFNAQAELTNDNSNLVIADFFLTEEDAIQYNNPIANPTNFESSNPSQNVYARVFSQSGCFNIAQIQLQINTTQIPIPDLSYCDETDGEGFATFNLSQIRNTIVNEIPTDAQLLFYETANNAENRINPLPSNYENTTAFNQTLFVNIRSNNQCFGIANLNLRVLETPHLLSDVTVYYCLNTFPDTITLNSGIINNIPANFSYEWQFNGATAEISTTFININQPGIYTVIVTSTNGCSSSRNITVLASEIAEIESITFRKNVNNTAEIFVSGSGNYEFALDNENGFYQDSNQFQNIAPGFHTVYVRDLNGCGISSRRFAVLGFPKYFTPNNDGFNDFWQVYGVDQEFNSDISIKIFDRYGKLLATINPLGSGWDGTFNGNLLPTNDYWYTATLGNGNSFSGHFTLKR